MGYRTYGSGKVVVIGTNAVTQSLEVVQPIGHFVFGNEGLNESFDYYREGHNLLAEPESSSVGGVLVIPADWLTPNQTNYFMDMTTGVFLQTNWTVTALGSYQFNVPANNLLLSVALVPEPSVVGMGGLMGILVLASRRRRVIAVRRPETAA